MRPYRIYTLRRGGSAEVWERAEADLVVIAYIWSSPILSSRAWAVPVSSQV